MHYYAARIMEYFPHYWRLHARAIVSPTSAFTSSYYLFLFIYQIYLLRNLIIKARMNEEVVEVGKIP